MKKIVLTALLAATTGCTASSPQEVGGARTESASPGATVHAAMLRGLTRRSTALATQEGETEGGAPDHDVGKVPNRRKVTPGSAGVDGGSGSGSGSGGATGSWRTLTNPAPISAGTALLLTDGSVMVQDSNASDWWKLTPDVTGSYLDGTWTQLASLPAGYAPLYFAAAVLPDGRVIVEGGEYDGPDNDWTTKGAIYDPTTDQWTAVLPPAGWAHIGDAVSTVLADGRFLLSNSWTTDTAIFDPTTLTWTAFGTGKADLNNEEGWTLLPNGKVLAVDTNNAANLTSSESLNPRNGVWSSAGSTIVKLADTNADLSGSWEIGPQMLRPDGTVFVAGATGHTAIYHARSGTWRPGPDFPIVPGEGQLDVADGPAALETNGHVLVTASHGVFKTPLHVFDFDGVALTEVAAPPQARWDSSYNTILLVLPTGEILFTDQSNDVELYASAGRPDGCDAPKIENGCSLSTLQAGSTYRLSGVGLHGVSQAVAYGDDAQGATNYPLVRITNRGTGHVIYARTHDHSSMSIAHGAQSETSFDVPPLAEAGASDLVVVANGIASDPIHVHVVNAQ